MELKNILLKTFKGKTILITGHTGFTGGWLALWLDLLGANVIGFSFDIPTIPSFFQEVGLRERVTDLRGNILDANAAKEVIVKYSPEFIFHLAAQPLVRYSYKHPIETFSTNVMGTANVLEAIRLQNQPAVCICITSDKCYENREWDYAYRENDPLGGDDPYSASKAAAELIIESYRKSYFQIPVGKSLVALSSARAGNIIGGGDWSTDRIIPDCIRSLASKDVIQVRNPKAIRPWQFVLDALNGYLCLAVRMKENPASYSEAWNFGPFHTNSIEVGKLVEVVCREWGSGRWIDASKELEKQVHEATFLKLDVAKAISRLGWRPVYSLDETVRNTIAWYNNYYRKGIDSYEFSLNQIEEYMFKAKKIFLQDP